MAVRRGLAVKVDTTSSKAELKINDLQLGKSGWTPDSTEGEQHIVIGFVDGVRIGGLKLNASSLGTFKLHFANKSDEQNWKPYTENGQVKVMEITSKINPSLPSQWLLNSKYLLNDIDSDIHYS